MTTARKMQLLLSACAILVSGLIAREGMVLRGYPDPVVGAKLPTACAGVTEGVVLGRAYTPEQCAQMTMVAMVKHAAPILPCVEREMPPAFLAEMADASYNLGAPTFLKSSMCREMKAGNLPAACDALLLYVYAGGKDCRIAANNCRGVVIRRQEARAACRKALA